MQCLTRQRAKNLLPQGEYRMVRRGGVSGLSIRKCKKDYKRCSNHNQKSPSKTGKMLIFHGLLLCTSWKNFLAPHSIPDPPLTISSEQGSRCHPRSPSLALPLSHPSPETLESRGYHSEKCSTFLGLFRKVLPFKK